MGKFAVLVQRAGKRFRAVTATGKTGFTAAQVAKLEKILSVKPGRIIAVHPIGCTADNRMTAFLAWSLAHEPQIHYPVGDIRTQGVPGAMTLPQVVDCSQFYTWMCRVADVADPSGFNYGGDPYTGSLLNGMQETTRSKLHVNDAVVFGSGTGKHVAAVYRIDDGVVTLCSHGQEKGPITISLDDESKYQASVGNTEVRYLVRPTRLL